MVKCQVWFHVLLHKSFQINAKNTVFAVIIFTMSQHFNFFMYWQFFTVWMTAFTLPNHNGGVQSWKLSCWTKHVNFLQWSRIQWKIVFWQGGTRMMPTSWLTYKEIPHYGTPFQKWLHPVESTSESCRTYGIIAKASVTTLCQRETCGEVNSE